MAHLTDDDLPGMWSHSDFEGGDPDERSYAERGWADKPFPSLDITEHLAAVDRAVRELADLSGIHPDLIDPPVVGYDGFGAPLYAHQLPPEGIE